MLNLCLMFSLDQIVFLADSCRPEFGLFKPRALHRLCGSLRYYNDLVPVAIVVGIDLMLLPAFTIDSQGTTIGLDPWGLFLLVKVI